MNRRNNQRKKKQGPALPELSALVTGAVGGMQILLQLLAVAASGSGSTLGAAVEG